MLERFTDNDWAHMHDCILDVTWNTTKKNCTRDELIRIFNKLPNRLKYEADEFGMNDTLWRDHFIEYIEENLGLIENNI